jgi:hypothetical protein
MSTQLVELEVVDPFVAGRLTRNFIDQGETGTMTLKLDQKIPFEGKAKLVLQGLPARRDRRGARDHQGGQGSPIPDQSRADAQTGQARQLFCQFVLTKDGEPMVNTFAGGGILRVDKGSVAQK